MKTCLTIAACLVFFIFLFIYNNKLNTRSISTNTLSEKSRLELEIIQSMIELLQTKYPISLSAFGGSKDRDETKHMLIGVTIYKPISIEEGRKIIIEVLDEFVKNVNINLNYQKYLTKTPFNEKYVDVTLFIQTANGHNLLDPDLSVITFYNEIITYKTHDPQNPNRYKQEIEETLDEARKKLSGEI